MIGILLDGIAYPVVLDFRPIISFFVESEDLYENSGWVFTIFLLSKQVARFKT